MSLACHSRRRVVARFAAGLAVLAILSGCGFQLRGDTNIPFKTLYIGLNDTSPLAVELKRNIRGNSGTQIVTDPNLAEARFEVLSENRDSDILSINSAGVAREYNLYYRFRFRVTNGRGKDFIPPTDLLLKRVILANNNAVLAQESEINRLYTDMQSDAVQQVLRRIEAIKPEI